MTKLYAIYYPGIKAWLGKNRPMLTKAAAVKFTSIAAATERAENIMKLFPNNDKLKDFQIRHG